MKGEYKVRVSIGKIRISFDLLKKFCRIKGNPRKIKDELHERKPIIPESNLQ